MKFYRLTLSERVYELLTSWRGMRELCEVAKDSGWSDMEIENFVESLQTPDAIVRIQPPVKIYRPDAIEWID